jgi:hypothetical protein
MAAIKAGFSGEVIDYEAGVDPGDAGDGDGVEPSKS